MTKRTIKTLLNKMVDSISDNDISTVEKFGNRYAFGEVFNLCNVAGDPLPSLERILKVASVAYALMVLEAK